MRYSDCMMITSRTTASWSAFVLQALLLTGSVHLATCERCLQLPPVDVVYAWVDGTDPVFARRFQEATNSSVLCSRTASSNEMLMALAATCRHQQWVHQVFIAVDQQRFNLAAVLPPTGCPPVRFVDLAEFVPPRYLPTFNSHVFETFLWRIPGLSEHFVYLNDDMILARPIDPSTLFVQSPAASTAAATAAPPAPAAAAVSAAAAAAETKAGAKRKGASRRSGPLSYFRVQPLILRTNLKARPLQVPHPSTQLPDAQLWWWPRYNGLQLFQSAFEGRYPARYDAHAAVLLTKQAMQRTWELFGRRLDPGLTANKKRRYAPLQLGGDVHFTSLAQQVGVELGLLTDSDPLVAYNVAHHQTLGAAKYLRVLFDGGADVVCLQDLRKLPDPDLALLCSRVAEMWCRPVVAALDGAARQPWQCSSLTAACSQRAPCTYGDKR